MHSADKQEGAWSETPSEHAGRSPSAGWRTGAETESNSDVSGNGAAADFLGLDQDAGQFGPASNGETTGSALAGSNSWLLSLEGELPVAELEPTAPEHEPQHEDVLEPMAGAAMLEEDGPLDAEAPAPPSIHRSRAALYALAATAVVATGGWFAWDWWQGRGAASGTETPIAVAPKPVRPAPKPTVEPAPLATGTAIGTPESNTTEPNAISSAAPAPAPGAVASGSDTAFEFGPRPSDGRVQGFLDAHSGGSDTDGLSTSRGTRALPLLATDGSGFVLPVAGTPVSNAPSMDSSVPAPETLEAPADTARRVKGSGRTALRIATDVDLAGVWSESTLPLDAIAADARLVTPMVGRVRLVFHDGELFEGRLYAVGLGQVWLDTELGRTALDSYRIARIEQLSSGDGTPALGAKGSAALAGLPRMRVRTPGGMLYGRVIDRDERTVTIVTEAGARITIETNEVEPAPEGRSLIVRGHVKPSTP